ncbi:MAG: dihydrolipoyl dehydrogenase [Rhodobacterales bacterium RIFCSPHIGHO2_02_FULL_62_130]|nr:MAG: dihydrolipoyl dehydrogenase [Rhodobacterales bacterium RIFCSPHIGHO2_02_FULL_62_130]OHC59957.1 MAG: dihydrolipoyl dehydrogenase [Rhodobacterales bacterium RIFCSPHIGHO2_12_FULL_62_75]HCY99613.1 dihydrolipoyl dehydrogenase [Rhodobacter sp.]
MSDYDILIIGAGPGGYVAAIRAAQLGKKVGLIERDHLGGICLNWGCIPTKAMLKGTDVLEAARHADRFGLAPLEPRIEPERLVGRAVEVSGQLTAGIAFLLKKNGVEVIWGAARLVQPGQVQVSETAAPAPRGAKGPGLYAADHVILATGARPRALPGLEADGHLVWTYREALRPKAVPERLIVVGSGAIGIEFASIYAALGAQVTVVELAPRILPTEDAEIAGLMAKALQKRGIALRTGVSVVGLDRQDNSLTAQLSDGSEIAADRLLSAAGVVANVDGLGLEALGVALDRGVVKADAAGRTSVPGLYAIGDLAGPPMLAHKAEHDGIACVEAIAGIPHGHHRGPIPACIYASPQIASVGLTEEAAKAEGRSLLVGRFSLRGNGKALVLGEPDGLAKCVFDAETDRLLGAQIIGAEASELIHGLTIAVTLGATSAQLAAVVFPHPTLSEALHEAVLAARGGAIHG